MSAVTHPSIEVHSNGRAYIAGTGFKVRMLVEIVNATGYDADEMCRRYPPLTREQLDCALAYYRDHKAEIDREIEEGQKLFERLQAEQGESLVAKKLRELGRELP